MKKVLRWSLTAMVLFGLSGCGLKGPLYFPPSDQPDTKISVPNSNSNDGSTPQKGITPGQDTNKSSIDINNM